MHIDVIPSINEARTEDILHKTVVVIDVLRATSTITTALEHGASEVFAVETIAQARSMHDDGTILGGERSCRKITGFDLGNSPLEYVEAVVRGKKVVLSTTNGTRAIQKAHKADHVLAGSFLNAACCTRLALQFRRDILLLCAGTKDRFSLEDGLCAGLYVERLIRTCGEPPVLNDLAVAMKSAYLHSKENLEEIIFNSENGVKLAKMGLVDDLAYCLKIDSCQTVPLLREQALTACDGSKILSGS